MSTSLRVVVRGMGVFQVLLGPRVVDSINNTISLRVNTIIPKIWEGHVDDFHLKVESYCYGLSSFAAKMKLFTGLSSFNYSFVKISLKTYKKRFFYLK